MFNLGDVFELIDDSFDQSPLTQQEFVGYRQKLISYTP